MKLMKCLFVWMCGSNVDACNPSVSQSVLSMKRHFINCITELSDIWVFCWWTDLSGQGWWLADIVSFIEFIGPEGWDNGLCLFTLASQADERLPFQSHCSMTVIFPSSEFCSEIHCSNWVKTDCDVDHVLSWHFNSGECETFLFFQIRYLVVFKNLVSSGYLLHAEFDQLSLWNVHT